jgi:hypothetical protein
MLLSTYKYSGFDSTPGSQMHQLKNDSFMKIESGNHPPRHTVSRIKTFKNI